MSEVVEPNKPKPTVINKEPDYKVRVPANRITVVEWLYHKAGNNQPRGHECRFTRSLDSDEQPYERTTKVEEDWKPLDMGWFKDDPKAIGMLTIVNEEGKFPQVMPTPEEAALAASKILEVAVWGEVLSLFAILPPGESLRFVPHDAGLLRVRSASGLIKYTLKLYPA